MNIAKIIARQIFDSRGIPTVEVDIWLDNGVFGRASVPSGASTGEHEAHELRDGTSHYSGKGVQKAIDAIKNSIAPTLQGMNVENQINIDNKMRELDGTENKSKLGANAILAVSLACAHAASKNRGILLYSHINDLAGNPEKSLPMPMMNILNGGAHAKQSIDIQECMIMPAVAKSFKEAMKVGTEIFHCLKTELADRGLSTTVGDEGGFAPQNLKKNSYALELIHSAVLRAKYRFGVDVFLALDIAASELYENKKYFLKSENTHLTAEEMVQWLDNLSLTFPIISIEDGLAQDDWANWEILTKKLQSRQLVGDDLLVTNTERLKKAIKNKCGNAILIKPNQIGTLSETLDAIKLAKKSGWNTIISHRSGETEDTTICHIAVGTGAGQIKTGGLSRSERLAKYNELLRIEEIDPTLHFYNPFSAKI